MKEKVVRGERNRTFAFGSAFGFSRQRASGNILARAVSLFRRSRVSGKLRRKRHNAVTPFATILQQGHHTCASDYNLPPFMEGAKDTQVHLSVGTQCRAGNFLLKSRKYCVRLRAML